MSATSWLLFCSLALLTAFSPGPAVLLAVSNAASHGARRALLGSAGNALGVFLVAATAMLGLGALLKTSAWLFGALKLAGAAYLIWLGIRQWRARDDLFARAPAPAAVSSPRRLFLQGLLVAATNPKSILFFTALLPQFMRADAPLLPQFFALTLSFAACTVLSHLCYVALARVLRRWFAQPRRARWLNRALGTGFAAMGVGLLRLRPAAV
ncbi:MULTISPECIES: LysE family translocator [unclassified Lysobacter]|uniref:LysE family translocator n=1 Tax=unclassified Lysobacter TaxID=2635362 RepID=UPI0006FC82D7|nr:MULTISPECIES: LysE family translocator [unclassified Lysobacter]KQZ62827.1 lysine transporter LysE [Lysobacter sp. Root559]KRC37250.1 lysine transporter LysE [Lysobacter sp. Root76]KRD67756.1 lysine transporter LysE [Lysobacter sp. Root96]